MGQKLQTVFRRRLLGGLAVVGVAALTLGAQSLNGQARAADVESIHFLIPGGAGGGWDGTARGTGEALTKAGLIGQASFENMSGGGGGKAIAHIIETASRQSGTLMVNSTPIVLRSLRGRFPQSFRDLTPIAEVIGDYGAFVVRADSPLQSWDEAVAAFKDDPKKVKVAGGSVKGSMDHLVAAQAFKAAGGDSDKVRYIAYDAGGKAMAGLLSGETALLSTGLGEALEQAKAGQVRILCVTAPEAVEGVPPCGEGAEFVNWRGFFGAPGLDEATADNYAAVLGKMYETDAWEEVRARNGWVNIYKPRAEFVSFLEEQEGAMKSLLNGLGIETVR